MELKGDRENLVKEIADIRNKIKRKHSSLTRGVIESEIGFRKQYKPLIEPLSKLAKLEEPDVYRSVHSLTKKEEAEPIASTNSFMEPSYSELMKRNKRFLPYGLLRSTELFPDRRRYEMEDRTIRKRSFSDPMAELNAKLNRSDLDVPMDTTGQDLAELDGDGMEDDRPAPLIAKRRLTETPKSVDQREDVFESPISVTEFLNSPHGRLKTSLYVKAAFKGPLAREYVLGLINDTDDSYDTTYGVHIDGETGKTLVGDSEVTFGADDEIIFKDSAFSLPGTRGLYELLFKKKPDAFVYSEEDLLDYKRILELTNAHRVDNSPNMRIRANSGYKYTLVIKKLFKTAKKGKGLKNEAHMVLDEDRPSEYVYWDDPNELCERLRLLMDEKGAGHTGHNNEIISIIEELTERGIIKGTPRS